MSLRFFSGWRRSLILSPILFVPEILFAQLCEGSLGDPIVDINLGAGTATHAGALPAGITSYTYSTADFPIDGSYTVENSTAGSGSIWWLTTDHTGDPGGYMMVVNASISLTDYFYKNTITGLCPGTLYEFAAWVMNLLRSSDLSPPNITFSIENTDGTVINSYTTGSIPLESSPVWKQYGFYFTTPASVSTVVIVMRNNSAGGAPANDIALDDITFSPCGPDVLAYFQTIKTQTDTICEGDDIEVNLNGEISAGYANPQYQWQILLDGSWQDIPGATALTCTLISGDYPAGTYTFRLTVAEQGNISSPKCRVVSNEINLVVIPRPVAGFFTEDSVRCLNEPVRFINTTQTTIPVSYEWDFGDGKTSEDENPCHFYANSGNYQVVLAISSPYGCPDTAFQMLTLQLLPIPTAAFNVEPTSTSIFNPTFTITDESQGADSCWINWGDGTVVSCETAMHDYSESGTYAVCEIVMNEEGCYDTACQTVTVTPEFRFFIPNAFTPNGDGLNDLFKPVLLGVNAYNFLIFNRFGEELYHTSDPQAGWDGYYQGALCMEGAYAYRISFIDDVDNQPHVFVGTVMLLKN